MREYTEQELVRRQKARKLIEKNIDPFGHRFDVTSNSKEIKDLYSEYTNEELEEKNIEVVVAGRIMTKRGKGKAGFMHIQDKFGQIQIYVKLDNVGEEQYELFNSADIGDIVGIKGTVFRTHMGELSVKAFEYIHLVKALRPLPEKYHGLVDVEERFRRRYVDLIMNEEARNIAFMRPKIIRSIQQYLDSHGYVEVETPILGTILGGAAAKPFITHHNTLDLDMYLRIATELSLKRLLVGGMDGVYEIGRLFRNEGMDRKHNPEFTTVELYKAYSDLDGMKKVCEDLFRKCVYDARGTYVIEWKGHTIDFEKPFRSANMVDLIREATGVDFYKKYTLDEAKEIAKQHGVEVEAHYEVGHIINAFFEKFVEETIVEPTFVCEYPIEVSPLAKKCKDERFTQRFEIFICGSEYGNAFTELNDPIDQLERFENQLKERNLGNDEANDLDEDFIQALEYGMPPAGGMGIGIDRLVMMITGSENIREVILFPHMKNK
ncbi:MAG: lysine--tRNA ligase [bacterium]|nr:lysine--tRNA ligase [bacterium]MDY4109063.1 lysine--tRNA ligase [Bacilli bacterium]